MAEKSTKKPATKSTTNSSTKTAPKSSAKVATKSTSKSVTASNKSTKTSNTTNNSTATKSTSKSTKHSNGLVLWGLNKTSFWCIGAMAILYLIASILSLCGLSLKIILALQGLATALAICLVACLAWRYVKNKQFGKFYTSLYYWL